MDAFTGPVELLKNELAAEVVRRFGELRLRVTGSSMLPAVQPADVLLVRRCPIEQAAPGDVILFTRHRRLFAHRVISPPGGAVLTTQGDGVAQVDPCVKADELLGKVVRIVRRGKVVRQPATPSLPARMGAALFRRSAMAGRVFFRLQALRTGA
jgi:DNA-directed RNA polymerase subunit H (RpoH/RPB5)